MKIYPEGNKEVVICSVCKDYQLGKLNLKEAIRNNLEMNANNEEHLDEVIDLIFKTEPKTTDVYLELDQAVKEGRYK